MIQSNYQIPYKYIPRDYQIPFLYEVEKAISGESKKRGFIQVWHRRAGKDKTDIADVAPRRLIKDPCLVKYIYPTLVMGRDNMWDGIGKDGFKYTDHIPEEIRAGRPNESRMKIPVYNEADPKTPSVFQIAGSDKPDSLRGGNSKMVIYSEYSEQDPAAWDVVEPILKENDGIAVFNFTPKGDNHARALVEYAKNHPYWHVSMISAKQSGIFTERQLEEIRQDIIMRFEAMGRSTEEAIAYFEQEYMISFESPVIGSYYGAAMRIAEKEKRITNVPYDEDFPVDTWWDLGVDDSMTLWFSQDIGKEIHFIDYYENSGEGIRHYIQILKERKYIYGKHYAPHDIEVREMTSDAVDAQLKTRREVARRLGVSFEVVPRMNVDEGIDATRRIFRRCWFDRVKCNRGIMALKNYKKDWDEKNGVFRPTPLHNWASHGADAFRTFGVGHNDGGGFRMPDSTGGVNSYYEGMPG